jgi:hypothetical protein
VVAGIIGSEAELLTGPRAEGKVGDAKLLNQHVAFVVAGVRLVNGYSHWGGNLIDADLAREPGEPGKDAYGEFAFAWNLDIFHPKELEVVSDGSDGLAHIRVSGRTGPFAFADHFVTQYLGEQVAPELEVVYDYQLGPDDQALRLEITLFNDGTSPSVLESHIAMANHGDGVYPFRPGSGFGDNGPGIRPYLAQVGRDLSYAVMSSDGDLDYFFAYQAVEVVFMDNFELAPGLAMTLTRQFLVSPNGSAGIDALAAALNGDASPRGTVQGVAKLPAGADASTAHVALTSAKGAVYTAPVGPGGGFEASLPPDTYEVIAYAHDHAASAAAAVTVKAGAAAPVEVELSPSAAVTLTVKDASGAAIPARVTFEAQGNTPLPFAPDAVRPEERLKGNLATVAWVIDGSTTVRVPAGTYEIVASRGFSYEIDKTTLTVAQGEEVSHGFTLERVVDTTGWVASDFHIHALRSPDSYVPYEIRALQAATEDLDVPVLTEHVYVSGLQSAIDAEGLEDELIGVHGQEVTTFAFGHFNAFPLIWDPAAPNLGAVFCYDKLAPALFDAIRAQNPADEIVQVNHPRGIDISAYFTYVGLDPSTLEVKLPDEWSTNWDAVEVFNGSCAIKEPYADWVGLTNHGHKKVLASGSDTHSLHTPPGVPRNWIHVDFDTLRKDHQNLVPAVRSRDLFVSCGPFVTFHTVDGVPMGGLAKPAADGKLGLRVVVQAPTWISLNEVKLLENGLVVDGVDLATPADPVTRFDGEFTVSPKADAWYALQVLGSGSMSPVSDSGAPAAFTNAIEVDADGDGVWTPPALQ